MLVGCSSGKIVRFISENWGVSSRQAENYIARARKSIEQQVKERSSWMLYEHIEARRYLRLRAYETGDFHTELNVLRDEAKLLGLYPKSSSHQSESGEEVEETKGTLTSEQQQELINAVLQRGVTGPDEQRLLKGIYDNDWLWYPQPGPQLEAYLSKADELFYGGAAGGGKTDLEIGLALTAHHRAVIFRRQYVQLKAIIDRGCQLVGRRKYNKTEKLFTIDADRSLELGALKEPDDWEKYQGRPHDFKGFDELSHFAESQYLSVTGWTRTENEEQRTRIVNTGNPPTSPEGRWVVKRWAAWLDDNHPNPAEPGELRWYAVLDGEDTEVEGPELIKHGEELIYPTSRTFIPARVDDNSYYVKTNYKQRLQALPEPLRSQMLYGDFQAGRSDDEWQVIPTEWVRLAQRRTPPTRLKLTKIGLDVARGGKDQTVIAPCYGSHYGELIKYAGQKTPDGPTTGSLTLRALENDKTIVFVDVIGIGSSAYDFLNGKIGKRAKAINVGWGSDELDKTETFEFFNLRSEIYWRFRESIDPTSGLDISLPDDDELLADLCAARYSVVGGKIKVESKEEIKKRIGRSPDCSDAVLLASLPLTFRRPKDKKQAGVW